MKQNLCPPLPLHNYNVPKEQQVSDPLKYPILNRDIWHKFLDIIYRETPETWRYLQSLLPVNETHLFSDDGINVNIYKLNNRLSEYCMDEPMLNFINLHSDFLGSGGQMDSKYTYDGLHLSLDGYLLWAELIGENLEIV